MAQIVKPQSLSQEHLAIIDRGDLSEILETTKDVFANVRNKIAAGETPESDSIFYLVSASSFLLKSVVDHINGDKPIQSDIDPQEVDNTLIDINNFAYNNRMLLMGVLGNDMMSVAPAMQANADEYQRIRETAPAVLARTEPTEADPTPPPVAPYTAGTYPPGGLDGRGEELPPPIAKSDVQGGRGTPPPFVTPEDPAATTTPAAPYTADTYPPGGLDGRGEELPPPIAKSDVQGGRGTPPPFVKPEEPAATTTPAAPFTAENYPPGGLDGRGEELPPAATTSYIIPETVQGANRSLLEQGLKENIETGANEVIADIENGNITDENIGFLIGSLSFLLENDPSASVTNRIENKLFDLDSDRVFEAFENEPRYDDIFTMLMESGNKIRLERKAEEQIAQAPDTPTLPLDPEIPSLVNPQAEPVAPYTADTYPPGGLDGRGEELSPPIAKSDVQGGRGTPPPFVTPEEPVKAETAPPPPPEPEVPSVTEYTVQSGDTLSKIARDNGTTVDAIAQANGIDNPNRIGVGQVLKIPNTEPSSSAQAPEPGSGEWQNAVLPPEEVLRVDELVDRQGHFNDVSGYRDTNLVNDAIAKFREITGDQDAFSSVAEMNKDGTFVATAHAIEALQAFNQSYKDSIGDGALTRIEYAAMLGSMLTKLDDQEAFVTDRKNQVDDTAEYDKGELASVRTETSATLTGMRG